MTTKTTGGLSLAAAAVLAVTSLSACDRDRDQSGKSSDASARMKEQYAETKSDAKEQYAEAKDDAKERMDQAGAAMDDATISTKVRAAIVAEPDLSVFTIDVDTKQGVVMLTGTVETDVQRKRASEVAREVKGVQSVNNELTLKAAG